jgi:hypothetical protein
MTTAERASHQTREERCFLMPVDSYFRRESYAGPIPSGEVRSPFKLAARMLAQDDPADGDFR